MQAHCKANKVLQAIYFHKATVYNFVKKGFRDPKMHVSYTDTLEESFTIVGKYWFLQPSWRNLIGLYYTATKKRIIVIYEKVPCTLEAMRLYRDCNTFLFSNAGMF